MLIHIFVEVLQFQDCRIIRVVQHIADAQVMLEIFVLEVGQMKQCSIGLRDYWGHVILFMVYLVDDDDAPEAFGQGLELQMAAPFPVLPHPLHILINGAIFSLVDKVPKEFLIIEYILASLLPQKHMGGLRAIKLVGDGTEKTVAITTDILQFDTKELQLFLEFLIVEDVFPCQLEGVPFAHLLHLLEDLLLFPALLFPLFALLLHLLLPIPFALAPHIQLIFYQPFNHIITLASPEFITSTSQSGTIKQIKVMSTGLAELMQKLNSTMSSNNKIGSTTTVNQQVDEMEGNLYAFKHAYEGQQKQQSQLQFQLKKLEEQTKTNFAQLNKEFSDRIDYLSQLFRQNNEQQASQFQHMEYQNKLLHEEHEKMHEIGAVSAGRTENLENSVGI